MQELMIGTSTNAILFGGLGIFAFFALIAILKSFIREKILFMCSKLSDLIIILECPLRPKILLNISVLNPFITDITIIKVATPNVMPRNENKLTIEIKPSSWRDFKYLKAIH